MLISLYLPHRNGLVILASLIYELTPHGEKIGLDIHTVLSQDYTLKQIHKFLQEE